MSQEPDDPDPHNENVGRYTQLIKDGKLLIDALTDAPNYKIAMTMIEEALDDDQLAHIALTVAADAALTRAENADAGGSWDAWWNGQPSTAAAAARVLRPTQ